MPDYYRYMIYIYIYRNSRNHYLHKPTLLPKYISIYIYTWLVDSTPLKNLSQMG